jgi:glycosyltransferase involved in cell wall biosynthesis
MDIVLASHTVIGGHFVVGSHHLARNFVAAGHRVIHLSTPITPAHLLRVRTSDIIRQRYLAWRGSWHAEMQEPANLVPMAPLPWRAARLLYRLGLNQLLWTVPSIKGLLRHCGMTEPDLLIIDQPYFAGLERLLRARTTLYRATDLYAEITGDPSCVAAEHQILNHVDGWIATSQPVFSHLQRLAPGKPSLLVENGVDVEHFSTAQALPSEYKGMAGPRLVYAGAIDKRFDTGAARALALAIPQASVILIGPVSDGADEALVQGGRLPNIHLLGPRPYNKLPAYCQHADAGLILMNYHPANGGRSPMKLYEYAAAGLPVVCRGTPEIARRAETFVFLYEDTDTVPETAAMALGQRVHLGPVLKSASVAASWAAKAQQISKFAVSIQNAV